jgi:hypothetical protein
MKKLLLFSLLISLAFNNILKAQITANQMGMLDFKVSQSLTASEMNGTTDITTKLQAAVNEARLANKTLFISSGTYKVSNTIECVLDFGGSNGWTILTPVCIVGSAINRPLIVLANSASGFSGANPKSVFMYRSNTPDTRGTDALMEGGIRSINIDLGTGNTKAAGIHWACAQYCFLEDIGITGSGFFAGFTGIGGANQLLANISVTGGQYGIYLPEYNEGVSWGLRNAPQNTITGCTFIGQSKNALRLWGYGGITMSGITIEQSSGTAIKMNGQGYTLITFPFSLIDSKITFTTSNKTNLAIENLTRCNLALYGLYVNCAGTIVNNNGDENLLALSPNNGWTHVARFNYIDKAKRKDQKGTSYSGTHYDAKSGILSTAAIVQTVAAAPPIDLVSKHIWASTPSFEDADAVIVPAGSTAAQIQSLINSNTKICFPKGIFSLSSPITLKSNTILFGCPGIGLCGTIIKNGIGFPTTSPNWLINTENSASATTYLMDITTDPSNVNNMGSLHWMAGANSIIRTVHFNKSWTSTEPNLTRLYFSDNGGGRVFNYQDEKGNSATSTSQNARHRKVKISGTSQPLTFYGLNLERGGKLHPTSDWPMCEIVNASKVRIFGAKTEASQPYATIKDCSDIFITNVIDYGATGYGLHGANQIEISGTSDQIEISNQFWVAPPDPSWKLILNPWNTNEPSRQMHLGSYHYNWSTIATDSLATALTQQSSVPENWTIFPNPTTSLLNIESVSKTNYSTKGIIYNMSGSMVSTFELFSNTLNKVDLSNLFSGIYFISIRNREGNTDCIKLLKH